MSRAALQQSQYLTRRQFFGGSAVGIGTAALGSLLSQTGFVQAGPTSGGLGRLGAPHFAPRAKAVIYLFMSGGPSHIDLLDYKPQLYRLDATPIPDSVMQGQRFAFIDGTPDIGGPRWKFYRHPQTGAYFSELLPNLASVGDRLSVMQSMHTDQFNHDPAVTFLNTGSPLAGRPVIGSWVSYGLGSMNEDLPGFVVLTSGNPGQPLQARYWGSGFLPSNYQGVQFRSQGDPVLSVSNPGGVSENTRRRSVDAINTLNAQRHDVIGDPEIAARIEQFELAYRMQTSVPELMRIDDEPAHVHELYGTSPGQTSFANNCLLARRLVERGVRYVQLYHTDWDHHGGGGDQNLVSHLPIKAGEIDQPAAALIRDLEQRGMLDETLVIWGGEFGRTPMVQGQRTAEIMGRDHNVRAFSVWMAGGGIKPGVVYGKTDELGVAAVEDPVHTHDYHATILHCLGIDHERLTYRFQGREFRLTDIAGNIITPLLA